ncbi:winged helix-turn-helix domain-containing protein [Catenulispora subtropica]|uniref:HTH marR-type domain-containing protein n=1 Tax=Catenulispora subtropica TaxID=450798 RepID=A0ABN2SJH5_9ACTN
MEGDERRPWTLLTSHGHVLVEIARDPRARVRDLSAIIGITERATQSIIADLERAGYVERIRVGRRTQYVLNGDNPFRHSAQNGLHVGPFLELLTGTSLAEGLAPAGPVAAAPEGVAAAAVPEVMDAVAEVMDVMDGADGAAVPPLPEPPAPLPGPAPLTAPPAPGSGDPLGPGLS